MPPFIFRRAQHMEVIQLFLQLMLDNSPYVIDAILCLGIGYLLWDRNKMQQLIKSQVEAIKDCHKHYDNDLHLLIDRYYNGNIELVRALGEIKLVLSILTNRHNTN